MKKALFAILIILLVVLLVVGGYVAYVFIDYHRIDDQLAIDTAQNNAQPLPADQELTFVSWNIGFGAYNDDYSFFMDGGEHSRAYSKEVCESNVNTVIERLNAMEPDVALIQEIDTKATRSHKVNQCEMVESAFSGHSAAFAQNYDSSYLFYPIKQPIGASESGILTLANAEISDAMRYSLPIEKGFRKFFDLDRCYAVHHIPVANGKTLALFNLHLSAYTADGTIATEQLEIILGHMQQEYDKGNYVIAGGDFNKDVWGNSSAYTGISGEDYSWAQPFPTELLSENFALISSVNEANPVLSCRDTGAPYEKGKTFEVTLDGFIVSDNVEVTLCEVLDEGFRVSDHNPIRMNIILK